MGSEYQTLSSAESCKSLFIETSECFICRDVELQASDPLRNFCDCKNLLSHHVCLSTWIQKGCESEHRLHCIICKAKRQVDNVIFTVGSCVYVWEGSTLQRKMSQLL
ncbi:hypothetical protein PBY51_024028 [Eleginops maclovinus]|uniref:RING-CH-type domain-containing protein n=1 Tax=Eleginops maclovinus TaxID=56733 RepID=A0AAN7XZ09_ELEMC|nr:hypothetical protein PBY51_024028 [Eleginops maclovinus]